MCDAEPGNPADPPLVLGGWTSSELARIELMYSLATSSALSVKSTPRPLISLSVKLQNSNL